VYVVGDSASDIRAAKESSVKSIAVSWGHQGINKLASARPDHLVHSPQELLELCHQISRPDKRDSSL
jgi:phosphoglycolate phosphatase-like HAD superfamily hydrolase